MKLLWEWWNLALWSFSRLDTSQASSAFITRPNKKRLCKEIQQWCSNRSAPGMFLALQQQQQQWLGRPLACFLPRGWSDSLRSSSGKKSQYLRLRRKAKGKRLQNQWFNMGPAARIPSHPMPDPLSEWKPGTEIPAAPVTEFPPLCPRVTSSQVISKHC